VTPRVTAEKFQGRARPRCPRLARRAGQGAGCGPAGAGVLMLMGDSATVPI
jgi:hypothetical protein